MTHESANVETPQRVELPRPTIWPLVVGLGLVLLAAGLATDWAFSLVGLAILVVGLAGWLAELMPGQGHVMEPVGPPPELPRPTAATPEVEHLGGVPGYRLRIPATAHPIESGIKGGLAGGLLMPLPALGYGLFSGHGIWFPVNLLAGMVLPGIDQLSVEQLEQFNLVYLLLAIGIHAAISLVLGLVYGVILPTLPHWPAGPIFWAGIVMPLLWSGASHGLMGIVNPLLAERVEWPWFVLSQLVFGITAAIVVGREERIPIPAAGTGRDTFLVRKPRVGRPPPQP